jgi:hypothetical protein
MQVKDDVVSTARGSTVRAASGGVGLGVKAHPWKTVRKNCIYTTHLFF